MASPFELWNLPGDQSSSFFLFSKFFLAKSNIIVIDSSVCKHHSDWLSTAISSEVCQLWSFVFQKGVVTHNLVNLLLLVTVLVLRLLVVLLHVSNIVLQVVDDIILVLLGTLQLGELIVQIHFLLSSLFKLLSGLLNLSLKTCDNL